MTSYFSALVDFVHAHSQYTHIAIFLLALSEAIPVGADTYSAARSSEFLDDIAVVRAIPWADQSYGVAARHSHANGFDVQKIMHLWIKSSHSSVNL
jgi:hypothetical protein